MQDRGNGFGTGVPAQEQSVCARSSDSRYHIALMKWCLRDHLNAGEVSHLLPINAKYHNCLAKSQLWLLNLKDSLYSFKCPRAAAHPQLKGPNFISFLSGKFQTSELQQQNCR